VTPNLVAPLLAAASGLALLTAHPPVGWWWLTFLHPPLMVAALWVVHVPDSRRAVQFRRAAGVGLITGLVAFAPMLSWLLVAPAGVLGWSLLVLVQGAWYGVLAVVLHLVLERRWFPLLAAVVWTGVEAWRGIIPLNGFEWGSIAYAHVDGSWMLPLARIVGSRGITFLVVVIGVAAAVAIRATVTGSRRSGLGAMEATLGESRQPLGLLVGGLLVSILATIGPPAENGDHLEILVVQGHDIRQWEETVPDRPLHVTSNMRDETLAAVAADGRPDLTIWPESSIDQDPSTFRGERLAPIAEEAIAAAGEVIAGVTLDAEDDPQERYVTAVRYLGSLDEEERYVKRRLVPFGEYIPGRAFLEWIPPLEQVPRDARSGEGAQQMTTSTGVTVATIICFETLFTDVARQNVKAGDEPAQLLLSLTNDASFGDTAEPYQHLAQVQMRAVETGRWAIHASLSGSSAFVDPDGRTYDETDLFTTASIRREVPLVSGVTPYLVIGDVVGWFTRLAVLVAVVLGVIGTRSMGRAASEGSELTR
jgi:apolipoprotein N-acyltransferase